MAKTEEVYPGGNLVELCSKSLYTLDGLWFSLLEKKHGLDVALDIEEAVWRRFCPTHLRRVLKTFPIKTDNPIQAVINLLQVDPIQLIYKREIVELTDSKTVFRITDCPPQKARVRDGKGEFPCKKVGMIMFQAYAEAIDPRIKLTCLVCPPDAHPLQYWCEWQFEI